MSGFNWPVLMRAALVGLRLTPDQFWRLTPVELQLMLGQGAGMPAMNRAGLDALLEAYPDKTQGERDDGS
ncbi:rcc01693 family protein [Ruegeria atlantica]|uniref:rcc01693 family protein n=1 Tax=Ruegeria atlantica TaxID=81569 RepID=UPI00147FF625|nr:rcc01693 family protein [Ruegeria atlantica]